MAIESSQSKLAIISSFPVAKVVVPVGTLTHTVVSHVDTRLVRQAGPSKHQVSLKLEVRSPRPEPINRNPSCGNMVTNTIHFVGIPSQLGANHLKRQWHPTSRYRGHKPPPEFGVASVV